MWPYYSTTTFVSHFVSALDLYSSAVVQALLGFQWQIMFINIVIWKCREEMSLHIRTLQIKIKYKKRHTKIRKADLLHHHNWDTTIFNTSNGSVSLSLLSNGRQSKTKSGTPTTQWVFLLFGHSALFSPINTDHCLSGQVVVQFSPPSLHRVVFSPILTLCHYTEWFSLPLCTVLSLSPIFTLWSSLLHLYTAHCSLSLLFCPVKLSPLSLHCALLSSIITQCGSLSHLYIVQRSLSSLHNYVVQPSLLCSAISSLSSAVIFTLSSHLYTVQFSLPTLHNTVFSPNFTQCVSLPTLHSAVLSPFFTQCNSLSHLYTVQFSLPTLHSAVFSPKFTQYSSLSQLYTVRLSPKFTQCISLSQLDTVQFSLQSLYCHNCADLHSVVLSPKFTQCSCVPPIFTVQSRLHSAVLSPKTLLSAVLSPIFTWCSHLYTMQPGYTVQFSFS